MKKILNYGLIAILGVMTVLAPSCTKDLEDDIDEIRTQMTPLEAKIKAVETRLADLTSIEAEIKATKDKITVIEGQIPTLATKADLTALATRVEALETWKGTVTTQLESIETQLGTITTANSALEEKLTNEILRIDGQFTAMTGKLETMESDIISKVDEKYAAEIAKIAAIETRVGELEATMIIVKAASENAETAENAKAEYEKIRKEIQDAIANDGVSAEELEEAISGIDTKITAINEKLTAINADITALKGRIQSINFVSEYADGMASIFTHQGLTGVTGDMVMKFRVLPAAQAASFTKESVSFQLDQALRTRATTTPSLEILSVTSDPATGEVFVTARPTNMVVNTLSTYNLSLVIKNALDNASSNVFAIAEPKEIKTTDTKYTLKSTQRGDAQAKEFEIAYNDTKTYMFDEEFVLGVFSNSKFMNTIEKHGFDNVGFYVTEIGSTVHNNGTAFTSTVITDSNKAEIVAGVSKSNFAIDFPAGSIKLSSNDEKFAGNVLTFKVIAKIDGVEISTSEEFTVKIIAAPTVKYTYPSIISEWAQTPVAINFDLTKIAIASGVSVHDIIAALQNANTVTYDGQTITDAPFSVTVAASGSLLTLTPTTHAKWFDNKTTTDVDNVYNNIVIKTTNATTLRNFEITIESIKLQLPVITYSKIGVLWDENNNMIVAGKYTDGASGITAFEMSGNLNVGMALPQGVTLPAGVKLEFEEVANLINGATINSNGNIVFNTYLTGKHTVRVQAKLVFGSVAEIPVAGFENFSVKPAAVITGLKNTLEGKTVDLTTAKDVVNLENLIQYKDTKRSLDLRAVPTTVTDQTSYFKTTEVTGAGKYATSSQPCYLFGLTNDIATTSDHYYDNETYAAKMFGTFYELGDITYADGTALDPASLAAVKTAITFGARNSANNGIITVDFSNIQLQAKLKATIKVKVCTFWSEETTTIPVTLQK